MLKLSIILLYTVMMDLVNWSDILGQRSCKSLARKLNYPNGDNFLLLRRLAFMHGDHGEPGSLQRIQSALDNARTDQAEIGLSKKNSQSSIDLMTAF